MQAIPCAHNRAIDLAHSRRLVLEGAALDEAEYEVRPILPGAGAWHRYLAAFETALVRGLSAPV